MLERIKALIAEIGHHHLRDLTFSKLDRMDLIVCIAVYNSSSIFFFVTDF